MHKHTQTHGETEPAKYQCTAAGPRRAAESNRERRHTLSHTPNSLTHTQPLSQLHSTLHSDSLIQRSVFWGHCLKARGVGRSGECEQRRRRGGKGKERKGEQNQEMEKKSSRVALLQKSSSLHSLVSIKRAYTTSGGRTLSAFSGEDVRPGSVCSSTRMDILQKKKEKTVFSVCSVLREGSRIRVWSLPGRCGFFFFCTNVEATKTRIESGKETESIMTKLGGEWRKRQSMERVCVSAGRGIRRQHCMKISPKKPLCSAARRDCISPLDLLHFYLSLCLSPSTYTSHANNIR